MKGKPSIPVNTLEDAFDIARNLERALRIESKTKLSSRIFTALAEDRLEGLMVSLIWWTRAQGLASLGSNYSFRFYP